jgi:hypothetical protein
VIPKISVEVFGRSYFATAEKRTKFTRSLARNLITTPTTILSAAEYRVRNCTLLLSKRIKKENYVYLKLRPSVVFLTTGP